MPSTPPAASGRPPASRRRPSVPVLAVRVGAPQTRVTRRAAFDFSASEARAAVAMLSQSPGTLLEETASLGPGMRGLRSRGLVVLSPSHDAAAAAAVTQGAWAHPSAAATAARRVVMPFNLAMRTQSMLAHAADVAEGNRHDFTATALAAVLAHRYQFTGVHALTIIPTITPTAPAASGAPPAGFEVIEHRHLEPDRVRLLPSVSPDPARLRCGGVGLDTDERRVLVPPDIEAMAVHAFYACRPQPGHDNDEQPPGGLTVHIDLDRLSEQPATTDPPWMPALLADALAHLGVVEDDLTTPAEFTAWAHERLRYPLRCGDYTHVRQINPSTGTVHTPTEYVAQYAAEEMLTALQLPAGEATGCAAAEEFLALPLDGGIWSGVADETVLRWVVRAVQYLDAGLDLHETADFLLFAIPAEQATHLSLRRRETPAEVNDMLRNWVRALLNRGTLT